MTQAEEWLTWPQAAELVGCPVPTIDWHTRTGRIEKRPHQGARPSLRRESVEAFTVWWASEQTRRAAGRTHRAARLETPPAPTGWITTAQAAKILGVATSTVTRHVRAKRVRSERRGRVWWVQEASVRVFAHGRAEWVSLVNAAELTGCTVARIQRAVDAGEITQRVPEYRAAPSIERASVERWALEHP